MWPFIAECPRGHALTDWLYLIETHSEIEREGEIEKDLCNLQGLM